MIKKDGSVADLYSDLDTMRYSEPLKESIQNTGAVVMGRKTFAMGNPDEYADNYEYQVPTYFILRECFLSTNIMQSKVTTQRKKT